MTNLCMWEQYKERRRRSFASASMHAKAKVSLPDEDSLSWGTMKVKAEHVNGLPPGLFSLSLTASEHVHVRALHPVRSYV